MMKFLQLKSMNLTAQQCASLITTHGDYGELASRILTSNHHKNTPATFYASNVNDCIILQILIMNHILLISQELWNIIEIQIKTFIESMIDYDRDYLIDYFGFQNT